MVWRYHRVTVQKNGRVTIVTMRHLFYGNESKPFDLAAIFSFFQEARHHRHHGSRTSALPCYPLPKGRVTATRPKTGHRIQQSSCSHWTRPAAISSVLYL